MFKDRYCIAFEKIDGTELKVRVTKVKGICSIEISHPNFWERYLYLIHENRDRLVEALKLFPEREGTFYGEIYTNTSFAGRHLDDNFKVVFTDLELGDKKKRMLPPEEFAALDIPRPKIYFKGILSDKIIARIRKNLTLHQGVVCKGVENGRVWMAKIKTNKYYLKLKKIFKDEWIKYW